MMLLLTAALLLQAVQQPEINYEISFPNAAHHEAQVSVTLTRLPARPLELRMARSSPGRYALRAVSARDGSVAQQTLDLGPDVARVVVRVR